MKTPTKHDDSHFACDYLEDDSDSEEDDVHPISRRKRGFATLERIIVHEMYPGGPKRTFLEGDWFTEVLGVKNRVEGTPNVNLDPEKRNFFNYQAKFVFLENCYERPVAIWPHDPILKTPRYRGVFDVIDVNQDQEST